MVADIRLDAIPLVTRRAVRVFDEWKARHWLACFGVDPATGLISHEITTRRVAKHKTQKDTSLGKRSLVETLTTVIWEE